MPGSVSERLRAYAEKDGRGYPDWAMRYVPIVRRLRSRGALGGGLILEVGANENGFSRFSGCPVIAVDIEIEHLRAARKTQRVLPVAADAAALPFAEDCFSVVVCVETFEHLNPMMRFAAVGEIARVMAPSGTGVTTFPAGGAAREAEFRISDAYWKYTQGSLRWLEEHSEEGLPDAETIAEQFRARLDGTHRITAEKNANLAVWIWMWKVLMCGWPGRGNAFFQVVLRWLTPLLCHAHFGTCYRSVIWIEARDRNPD